jgi:hypothetical protein
MAESRKQRLPYQISRGGFLAVTTAFTISLCLLGYGGEAFLAAIIGPEPASPNGWWAFLAGASFMGGALGAVIGQVFRDERGGAASMGAFIGALGGPPIVLFVYLLLVLAIWSGN